MNDQEIRRLECLRLAHDATKGTLTEPDTTIARARIYDDFVGGEGVVEHAKRIAGNLFAKLKRGEISRLGRDEVEAAVSEAWPDLGLSDLDKDVFRRYVYQYVVTRASL